MEIEFKFKTHFQDNNLLLEMPKQSQINWVQCQKEQKPLVLTIKQQEKKMIEGDPAI